MKERWEWRWWREQSPDNTRSGTHASTQTVKGGGRGATSIQGDMRRGFVTQRDGVGSSGSPFLLASVRTCCYLDFGRELRDV